MIKIFDKHQIGTQKMPNFRIIRLIGTRQLEVSDPTGTLRKVKICDVHKVMPLEVIKSCIPDEQVFARKGKYINDPRILMEVMVIDTFLQDNFPDIRFRCQ